MRLCEGHIFSFFPAVFVLLLQLVSELLFWAFAWRELKLAATSLVKILCLDCSFVRELMGRSKERSTT